MGFAPKVRFAPASSLEGDGFEPSVPRERGLVNGMESPLPFESGGEPAQPQDIHFERDLSSNMGHGVVEPVHFF
jgi:hypothetical protein